MTEVAVDAQEGGAAAASGLSKAARRATVGLVAGAVLVVAAAVVPALTGVDVLAGTAPPLLGDWALRVSGTSVVAVLVVAGTAWPGLGSRLDRLTWGRLLALSWVGALVWMVALALVDGADGMGKFLDHGSEYLQSARTIDDVGALLRGYVARIPADAPGSWPVHLAGHPPGAVLVFVGLDRLGLGSWQAVGAVVVAVAATVPAAVAVTLDRLGVRSSARAALPLLAIAPAAVLMAVSADALFAAAAAWGMAALAAATAARRVGGRLTLAGVAGVLLGYCVMLSYGLVLLGVLAVAVLLVGKGSARVRLTVLVVAAVSALGVVLGFAAAGFAWWEAYPVLTQRYWAGIASQRPAWYWVFGNLAALVLVAGPLVPAGLAAGWPRLRGLLPVRRDGGGPATGTSLSTRRGRADPVAALVAAGLVMVVAADLSLMSKAEVERIWLPFVPWLLLSLLWLPPRWARWALPVQAAAGLLLQHGIRTLW